MSFQKKKEKDLLRKQKVENFSFILFCLVIMSIAIYAITNVITAIL